MESMKIDGKGEGEDDDDDQPRGDDIPRELSAGVAPPGLCVYAGGVGAPKEVNSSFHSISSQYSSIFLSS